MHEQEEAFIHLYQRCFLKAAALVKKLGGGLEVAKDIFHDAMVIYLEKRTAKAVEIKSTPEAYILGIVKILWLKKYGDDKRHIQFDEIEKELTVPEDFYVQDEREIFILTRLKNVAQKCMQLLTAFYYEGLSMQEMAEKFGFNGIRSATVQKHKCLEKVRDEVKKIEAYDTAVS